MICKGASPPQGIAFEYVVMPNSHGEVRCIVVERLEQETTICTKDFSVGFEDRFQKSRR